MADVRSRISAAWTRWATGRGPLASFVWAFGTAITIILSIHLPEGVLADPLLPDWVKVSLMATEAAWLGVLVAISTAADAGLRRLGEKARSAPGRRGLEAIRFLAPSLTLFLLMGSWAVFWALGRFIDLPGAGFLATNFAQLIDYARMMNPWLLAIVPLAAVATGVAGVRWLPPTVARWPEGLRSSLARLSAICFGLMVTVATFGEIARRYDESIVDEPITGIPYPLGKMFQVRRDQRSGPVTCFMLSLLPDSSGAVSGGRPPAGVGTVERPPLRSLDEYRSAVDPARRRPWNVVVVVVDSVRPDCLGAYGRASSITPALDALARESVVFSDCYTPASHTTLSAICPLTGQYPLRGLGIWKYPERPTYPRVMIYDVLHSLGYRTGLFSSQNEHWGHMSRHLLGPGLDRFFHAATADPGGDPGPILPANDHNTGVAMIDDRVTIDAAAAWIEESTGPFCLSINLQAPHFPYALAGRKRPAPVMTVTHIPRDRLAEARGMYEECITYSDAQIGRLIDRIKARGEWDRTVFVVTADHGEAWYEHGFPTHAGRVYDEVMKVPLLVRAPGLEARMDSRPALLIDIPPTILDLLGLPPHGGFQGENLLDPAPRADRCRYMMSETVVARQYAIAQNGFKLIRDVQYGLDILYDLKADPGERTDVRDRYLAIAQNLGWRLDGWIQEQLSYYGDRERHAREFPPRFRP